MVDFKHQQEGCDVFKNYVVDSSIVFFLLFFNAVFNDF